MSPRALAVLLITAMCVATAPMPAAAQSQDTLVAQTDALLRSASVESLDGLFQSVHAVSTSPEDAATICRALASPARSSGDTFLQLAQELTPANRDRLTGAIGDVALSAWLGQPAAFDEKAARLSLRQAGVRAAILNEGFSASALGAIDAHAERDAEVEALRCRSVGWLLDAVAGQPLEERAAITRLMLRDGLASLLQAAVEPSPDVSNPDH